MLGDHPYYQQYTLTLNAPVPSNPLISSVVNAASSGPAISSGAWVTITGSSLANSNRSFTAADMVDGALPSQLDGVSVTIDSVPAYVAAISSTQITVQAPADDSLGTVGVVVSNNGLSSASFAILLQPASPEFYQWIGGYSAATTGNCVTMSSAGPFDGLTAPPTQPDGVVTLWGMALGSTDPSAGCAVVSPPNLYAGVAGIPAQPGGIVILFGTGFGPTDPSAPPGEVAPDDQVAAAVNLPSITIGGIPAQVLSCALTPGQAGLYQIAVQVPAGLADGDQPVIAVLNGVQSTATALINVQN